MDLRPTFERARRRGGRNTVYQDRNLRITAIARRGRLVSVEAVNVSGRTMTMSLNNQQGSPVGTGRRPCVYCYLLDRVLESGCIEFDCDIVRYLRRIDIIVGR